MLEGHWLPETMDLAILKSVHDTFIKNANKKKINTIFFQPAGYSGCYGNNRKIYTYAAITLKALLVTLSSLIKAI